MWVAPNQQILDLDTVQADDMLVIGTHHQLQAASRFPHAFWSLQTQIFSFKQKAVSHVS